MEELGSVIPIFRKKGVNADFKKGGGRCCRDDKMEDIRARKENIKCTQKEQNTRLAVLQRNGKEKILECEEACFNLPD